MFRQWKEGCRKPGKANGLAKYLENHGIHKIARQNGKNPLFDAVLIRRIIQNPVYSGKISYGRRQKRFMVQEMSIGRLRKTITC